MKEPNIIFEPTAETAGDKKHILIIDDDVTALKALRLHLQDVYRVSVVNSARGAMEFLLKHTPDLILLDYQMPMYNGATVLKIIQGREATRNVPVFFLTGQADVTTVMECLALKPAGYIVKPLTKAALLEKLKGAFVDGADKRNG